MDFNIYIHYFPLEFNIITNSFLIRHLLPKNMYLCQTEIICMLNIATHAYCSLFIVAYNLLYCMLLPYYNRSTVQLNDCHEKNVPLKQKKSNIWGILFCVYSFLKSVYTVHCAPACSLSVPFVEWMPSIFPYCTRGRGRLLSFSNVQFSPVIVPVAHCLSDSQ